VKHGFNCTTHDFTSAPEKILELVQKSNPLLIGFSLIFQYYIDILKNTVNLLRENDVKTHITVGGHYPSLRPKDFLNYVDGVDSVVRFEGELTTLELAQKLHRNECWKKIQSIAYKESGKYNETSLRPLISNLDDLPFPIREYENMQHSLKIEMANILASRGCFRDCVFCSIRAFYGTPPGKIHRKRSPENIVNEMKELHDKGVKIFFFQDDDFLQLGYNWLQKFTYLIEQRKLNDIMFKISCRSDEIKPKIIALLKNAGLFLVYLGIESGYPEGLEFMNKHLMVEDSLDAIKILNDAGILFEYGFMLFEPISTFESVRTNLNFLKQIIGDGSSPAVFCKMLPYSGTPLEEQLRKENRLIGGIIDPDYSLKDSNLDAYCKILHELFHEWMFQPHGIQNKIRVTRIEIETLKHFYPHAIGITDIEKNVKDITKKSNNLFLTTAEKLLDLTQNGYEKNTFVEIKNICSNQEKNIHNELRSVAMDFMKNQ
jgi:radical SAM superfamily enzyme YgiQ (UPF0313 family)